MGNHKAEIESIETTRSPITSLAKLDGAVRALAEASTLDEVKHIADIAEAARTYAKAAKLGLEAQNKAAEIHIRAQRKAGEMLAAMEKNKGELLRGNTMVPREETPKLKDLGIDKMQSSRWQRIASVPEDEFEAHIREVRGSNREITTASVLAKERELSNAARNSAVQVMTIECTETLDTLITSGATFGTIYANPPWARTMTTSELCALPVGGLAADRSHLHLWTTHAFLGDAKQVIDAWGFTYKSCFVWVQPAMGPGDYWRISHEFLLLGVRGSCPFIDKSLKSWAELERSDDHRKPEEIRRMIERGSPGPRIELFARQPVTGWTAWGNQIEGDRQAEETPRTSEALMEER